MKKAKVYFTKKMTPEAMIAMDQACLDLVYASKDAGKKHLIQRIESRNGVHIVEAASEIGVGNREYELIVL